MSWDGYSSCMRLEIRRVLEKFVLKKTHIFRELFKNGQNARCTDSSAL